RQRLQVLLSKNHTQQRLDLFRFPRGQPDYFEVLMCPPQPGLHSWPQLKFPIVHPVQHAVDIVEEDWFLFHGLMLAPPEMLPLRLPSHPPCDIVRDKSLVSSFRGVLYIRKLWP